MRNASDLNCMAAPVKYREIGDFHEYYSGARTAPCLTLFIGGNHEASSYMQELYYGGWVAPNIYYMGAANVVCLGPLRIAGLSGIWKGYNYKRAHHERLPYNSDDIRSVYHVRELDVRKLLQVRTQVDIGLSHDWPRGVEWSGDHRRLFSQKNLFEAESRAGTLGSAAAKYVLDCLRPAYWFSAHMHIKFSAIVTHETDGHPGSRISGQPDCSTTQGSATQAGERATPARNADERATPAGNADEIDLAADMGNDTSATVITSTRNSDEIDLGLDDDLSGVATSGAIPSTPSVPLQGMVPDSIRDQLPASFAASAPQKAAPVLPPPAGITNQTTQFLALDKCLPGRRFLQLLEISPISKGPQAAWTTSPSDKLRLEYDQEWLAITRAMASELDYGDRRAHTPAHQGEATYKSRIEQDEAWVEANIASQGKLGIPENFSMTAPQYDEARGIRGPPDPVEYTNPQTAAFCELLEIQNKFHASKEERDARMARGPEREQPRSGGGARGGRGGRGSRGHRGRGRGGSGRGDGRY